VSRPIRILELRSVAGTGGGPEKTILLGAARSDPERYKVTVAYLHPPDDPLFTVGERARALGVDYVDVMERGAFDRQAWNDLRAIVRDRQIDIVHAHDYKTDLFTLMLARVERITPLTTAHGWTGHSTVERYVYYPGDKFLIGRFPRVIAVSSEIRDTLVRWGCRPGKISVVLNGIDHLAFRRDPSRVDGARVQFGVRDGQVVIGSVGRLEPQKRFDLLIDAFADLAADRPDLRLLIAGEGSQRSVLEAQIAARNLGQRCRLVGHTQDVAGFHHAIDVFVQSSAYEGTPNVVLEAMAFESPVVATRAGGTAELVRDGIDGVLLDSGSAEQLRESIARVLDDPSGARERALSARRRVETDLSFESRMRAVEAIYDELVRR
jgi:glycosyltransferase involved in cell wall biosynthesis